MRIDVYLRNGVRVVKGTHKFADTPPEALVDVETYSKYLNSSLAAAGVPFDGNFITAPVKYGRFFAVDNKEGTTYIWYDK